jgi:type I restriction enzyme M protein
MGAEGKIRSKVLELDLIEAVIGLGPNLFYGTGLAACIVVARRTKIAERKGKVLLVDGSDLFRKGKNQNTLEQEQAVQLMDTYAGFADQGGRARVVALDEIVERNGNLNLASYVDKMDDEVMPSVTEAAAELRAALESAWEAEDRLNALLVERRIG